jgi:glycosyltransferase involved in cell wall biosynthesis
MMVSIIIPVYNRQSFLMEALDSIAKQTHEDWQLVVIDDGSTDQSVRLVVQFEEEHKGKVKLLYSKTAQSGAAKCRNIGINAADGDVILFLDSDDKLEPFCLEQRVRILTENPLIDCAVFLQYAWMPDKGLPPTIFNKPSKDCEEASSYFFQMEPAWQTMAPIWKKYALDHLKGFDDSLMYMEDPDLHLRALLDNKLHVSFFYDLPADNYYRIGNVTDSNMFYRLSIESRFAFLNKLLIYLKQVDHENNLLRYKRSIRKGFYSFLKVFLLYRIGSYKGEFSAIVKKLKAADILTGWDIYKLALLRKVFLSNSKFFAVIRLRGIFYKLLLN